MFPILLMFMADISSAATTPPPVKEKLICKREAVTGSLARFRKTCRTEQQWLMVQNMAQDEASGMQDRGLINSEAPK